MKNLEAAQKLIEKKLKTTKPMGDPHHLARYVGAVGHEGRDPSEQSGLDYLGWRVPQVRSLYREVQGLLIDLPPKVQLEFWDSLWGASGLFEVKSLSIEWLGGQVQLGSGLGHWPRVRHWVHGVDNWAHSDGLSAYYAWCLEQNPKLLDQDFLSWNRSRKPWLRRQSLVGLIYYSRSRKRTPSVPRVLERVRALKKDPHFYVQRGVGWTLREVGNVDKKGLVKFLKKESPTLSSIAFATATEKLSHAEKLRLKKLRG